jgi:hypothetical protein
MIGPRKQRGERSEKSRGAGAKNKKARRQLDREVEPATGSSGDADAQFLGARRLTSNTASAQPSDYRAGWPLSSAGGC